MDYFDESFEFDESKIPFFTVKIHTLPGWGGKKYPFFQSVRDRRKASSGGVEEKFGGEVKRQGVVDR